MMEEGLVVAFRAIIAFFTLLIYTRLLGKQQMGNLTYFDYINGITIGSIAGTLATDLSAKAYVHWLGLTIFIFITLLLQIADIKSRYISKVIDSEPVVLIQNGKMLENNLQKSRVTKDELMIQLRVKNMFDLTKIEYALLEPDGNVTVLPKSEYQPVTRKDLHIHTQQAKLTTEVIIDGIIFEQNLKQRDKDMDWLEAQLKAHDVKQIKEVSYAAILPNDQLYVDKFDDRLSDKGNISDYQGPF